MNTTTTSRQRQRGVATVEFSIICVLFITLLFAALEFARMLYVFNSLQEVTRRAAREMTVRWKDDEAEARLLALFGESALPGGAELTSNKIIIEYLTADNTVIGNASLPSDPGDNLSACGDATRTGSCIHSVRVTVEGVQYVPMISLLGFPNINLPKSTVKMHAESMGFET